MVKRKKLQKKTNTFTIIAMNFGQGRLNKQIRDFPKENQSIRKKRLFHIVSK